MKRATTPEPLHNFFELLSPPRLLLLLVVVMMMFRVQLLHLKLADGLEPWKEVLLDAFPLMERSK